MPTRPRHTAEDKGVRSTKFLLQAIRNMWAHLHQVTRWVRNGSGQLRCTRKAASQARRRASSNRIMANSLSSRFFGDAIKHKWSGCVQVVYAQLVHNEMQVKAPRQVLVKTSLASSLSDPPCPSARTLVRHEEILSFNSKQLELIFVREA